MPPPQHKPVNILDLVNEIVDFMKYLGVHLNNKLDWSDNTDTLFTKGESHLHLLRLRSFGVCMCKYVYTRANVHIL